MMDLMLLGKAAEKVREGYPWAFAGDMRLTSALETAAPGTLVRVLDPRARPLGIGTFHHCAAPALRMFARGEPVIDEAFFRHRFAVALAKREAWFDAPYYRLAHSEGDALPGLVIDRYGALLAVQATTAGMERLRHLWLPALRELLAPQAVIFRNDTPARAREGLSLEPAWEGAPPPMPIEVRENGAVYFADLLGGQKTGWFYDQRANRAHVAAQAKDKTVLDLYAHSGGFGIAAALGGATRVTMVDASASALALAGAAAERNGVAARCAFIEEDVFRLLQKSGDPNPLLALEERYGIVVADPPAFIKERRYIASGLKGYEKLARGCAGLVAEGGILFIASCSHHAAPEAFRRAVEAGMRRAGRSFRLLCKAGAGRDHPAHPLLPENAYLKALTYVLNFP